MHKNAVVYILKTGTETSSCDHTALSNPVSRGRAAVPCCFNPAQPWSQLLRGLAYTGKWNVERRRSTKCHSPPPWATERRLLRPDVTWSRRLSLLTYASSVWSSSLAMFRSFCASEHWRTAAGEEVSVRKDRAQRLRWQNQIQTGQLEPQPNKNELYLNSYSEIGRFSKIFTYC